MKLNALTKICKFMSLGRKSFIKSQFAYCSLVWMCCGKASSNHITHLQERALRTVCNENESTLEKVAEKDNSATFHHRNLRILTTELCKSK